MIQIVKRPNLSWSERIYLPAFLGGFAITIRHFIKTLLGFTGVTLEYPEKKWTLPKGYRGAPALVKDETGREKCVACQLCEFICPPRAITIRPAEIPSDSKYEKVERYPEKFEIDMLRCIYCGMCEEVCPEQAIFLKNEYGLTGCSRAEMVYEKDKLLEMGGTMEDPIRKWKNK